MSKYDACFHLRLEPLSVNVKIAKRARLLEVLYSFNVGGSELLGLELASQLQGNNVEVLCTALQGISGPLLSMCQARGIQVIDLGLPLKGLISRNGVSIGLVKRLKALNLDAIHLQHFLSLNKVGLAAKVAGVRRVVVTEHSLHDVSQSLAGRMRIRLNWRLADMITTVHPQIREYLINDLGLRPSRVVAIPVGIEVRRWHREDREERRRILGFGPNDFVFAFVGRFAKVKNVPELIRTFLAYVSESGASAHLILVGDGEDMQVCRDIVRSASSSGRVRFVGEVEDARPILAAADAFLMNSSSEGTPRSLLEAMAVGLPCACPAVGGIPSLLGTRGWLFPRNDSTALVKAMTEIGRDPINSFRVGESGRSFVTENFDAAKISYRYRDLLFPDLVANRKRPTESI